MKQFLSSVLGILALTLVACSSSPQVALTEHKEVATETPLPATPPPKQSCPVKLTKSRMVHNLEMDVYTTVTNISNTDIVAIAFGAAHTDKFGDTWEPYKTDLSSEDTIKQGSSQSMHWELLMEQPTRFHGKPDSSELYISKVALADGRVLTNGEMEGCVFIF
jgi:hypothetical protein